MLLEIELKKKASVQQQMQDCEILDVYKTYLTEYIENCKFGQTNKNTMAVLVGGGATGKSTLISRICEYLGKDNICYYPNSNKRLIVSDSYDVDFMQLSNLVKLDKNIIITALNENDIPEDALDYCILVDFKHRFN